jgi:hypothetical protein
LRGDGNDDSRDNVWIFRAFSSNSPSVENSNQFRPAIVLKFRDQRRYFVACGCEANYFVGRDSGAAIHVSEKYMDRYLKEFTFRSNHRQMTNAMFRPFDFGGVVARRLMASSRSA